MVTQADMWKRLVALALFQITTLVAYDFTAEQVVDYHNGTSGDIEDLDSYLSSGFFEGIEAVLDVGCGDGQITARLAKQFPKVQFVGCDISKEMIAFATQKYSPSDYPNLTFLQQDACHLGYKEQFDRVISFSSLHWISDQKLALKAIYAALKPGGKVVIRSTPKTSNNDFKAASMKVILTLKWMTHFMNFKSTNSFHSERDYRKIVSHIGFSIDHIEQKKRELVFADRDHLFPFLKGILTPLHHLPKEKKEEFLGDYYKALDHLGNVKGNGEISIHFDKIELALSRPR